MSDAAFGPMSGTSMAAPHVAGAAALYLETHPAATPAEVAGYILSTATRNVLRLYQYLPPNHGTPNAMLRTYTGQPWSNASPVASFTWKCTRRVCPFDASLSSDDHGSRTTRGRSATRPRWL
jgi:hypothetical protein